MVIPTNCILCVDMYQDGEGKGELTRAAIKGSADVLGFLLTYEDLGVTVS